MYQDGMAISALLAARIEARGISQTVAAAELGVAQSVVSRWLRGDNTPGDEQVPQLVKFLGVGKQQVLAALHEQRVNRASLSLRVDRLEAEMAELRATLQAIQQAIG